MSRRWWQCREVYAEQSLGRHRQHLRFPTDALQLSHDVDITLVMQRECIAHGPKLGCRSSNSSCLLHAS